MNLFDLMEMLVDWKAASERHKEGNIFKSIEINVKRFKISEQLHRILYSTACSIFPDDERGLESPFKE